MYWFFTIIQMILGAIVGGLLGAAVIFIVMAILGTLYELYDRIRSRRKK